MVEHVERLGPDVGREARQREPLDQAQVRRPVAGAPGRVARRVARRVERRHRVGPVREVRHPIGRRVAPGVGVADDVGPEVAAVAVEEAVVLTRVGVGPVARHRHVDRQAGANRRDAGDLPAADDGVEHRTHVAPPRAAAADRDLPDLREGEAVAGNLAVGPALAAHDLIEVAVVGREDRLRPRAAGAPGPDLVLGVGERVAAQQVQAARHPLLVLQLEGVVDRLSLGDVDVDLAPVRERAVGGHGAVDPERHTVDRHVGQQVGAAIADVGHLEGGLPGQPELRGDVPLLDGRRLLVDLPRLHADGARVEVARQAGRKRVGETDRRRRRVVDALQRGIDQRRRVEGDDPFGAAHVLDGVEDPVAAPHHDPLGHHLPRHAEARRDVVAVGVHQVDVVAGRVDQLPGPEVEVDVLVLAGAVVRRAVLVAESGVDRQVRRDLDVVLDEAREDLLAPVDDRHGGGVEAEHRAEQEVGDVVAGVLAGEAVRRAAAADVEQFVALEAHLESGPQTVVAELQRQRVEHLPRDGILELRPEVADAEVLVVVEVHQRDPAGGQVLGRQPDEAELVGRDVVGRRMGEARVGAVVAEARFVDHPRPEDLRPPEPQALVAVVLLALVARALAQRREQGLAEDVLLQEAVADEQSVIGARDEVRAEIELVRVLLARPLPGVVVGDAAARDRTTIAVGFRVQPEHLGAERIPASLRDRAIGEQLPRDRVTHVAIEHALPLRERRHGQDARGGEVLTEPLIGPEEEQSVARDRPAEGGTALMPGEVVLAEPEGVGIPRLGRQRGIAVEVPARAADLIGARLDGDVDHRARRSTELGRVAVGLHLELVDRIRVGLHHLRRERLRILRALVVVEPVEHEVVLRVVVAVGDEPPGAAGLDRHRAGAGAGHEQRELAVAACRQRQLHRNIAGHHLPDRAVFGLQTRPLGGDLHRFGRRGRIERDADELALVDVDVHAAQVHRTEARQGDAHVVAAARQRRERHVTFAVGDGVSGRLRADVAQGHRGARHDGAGLVEHEHAQRARVALASDRRGRGKASQDAQDADPPRGRGSADAGEEGWMSHATSVAAAHHVGVAFA